MAAAPGWVRAGRRQVVQPKKTVTLNGSKRPPELVSYRIRLVRENNPCEDGDWADIAFEVNLHERAD